MKKLTSKSVFGKRRTSSRSGTSGKTEVTGATSAPLTGPFAGRVARFRKLTPKAFRRVLVETGIIDQHGELTAKYRTASKRK